MIKAFIGRKLFAVKFLIYLTSSFPATPALRIGGFSPAGLFNIDGNPVQTRKKLHALPSRTVLHLSTVLEPVILLAHGIPLMEPIMPRA